MPLVQTFAAKKVASYLSKELGVPITVNSLEIDFWNQIILKKLYVEDKRQDTLLYLGELNVAINELDFSEKEIGLFIHLVNPFAKTFMGKGNLNYNHQFLVDYFSATDTTKNETIWKVNLYGIRVSNGTYLFEDDNKAKLEYGVDYFHLKADSIQLLIEEVEFNGDSIGLKFTNLSLIEQSGFYLTELTAKTKIYPGTIDFKQLRIVTGKSIIRGSYSMQAPNFSNYLNYNQKVEMVANLKSSTVAVEDLMYFVPQFKGIENSVFVHGKVQGTVANLKCNDLQLIIDNDNSVEGDFSFKGLPEIENTFIYADVKRLKTSAEGLRKIPVLPFESGNTLDIPTSFNQLEDIRFAGNFTGYINDFVAFGEFKTELGTLKTDILLKQDKKLEYKYNGKVSSEAFQLGKFINQDKLEGVGLDLVISGSGFLRQSASFTANGNVHFIDFNGYRYKGIQLNGGFKQEAFLGLVTIIDTNLRAKFEGKINLNKKKPVSKFSLEVKLANLAVLNIFNKNDSLTKISFQSEIDLEGVGIDDISGTAVISNLKYSDLKLNHTIKEFSLLANRKEEKRNIQLNSSFVDAKLEGSYSLKQLPSVFENVFHQFIMDSTYEQHKVSPQELDFVIDFKNTKAITTVLIPKLTIDSGLRVVAHFSSVDSNLNLRAKGPKVGFDYNEIENLNISLIGLKEAMSLELTADVLKLKNAEKIKGVALSSKIENSQNDNRLTIESWGEKVKNARFTICNQFSSLSEMTFSFLNSSFFINDAFWKIADDNKIKLDSNTIDFYNLFVSYEQQQLAISGKASTSIFDTLNVSLQEIDLAFISSLLPENTVDLKGVANGTSSIVSVFDQLSLTTNLAVDSLFINTVDVGRCYATSTWDSETNALLIDANLGDKEADLLKVSGSVNPLKFENSLDLSLHFNKFPLELIRPYLVDYINDIEGFLNGEVTVGGKAEAPELKGILGLNKTKFHVNYLNTGYSIDDNIIIEPDFIGFNLIKVKDENDSIAIATGTVFHENFTNFNYDIGLEFNNFLCLNTSSKDNTLFYGKGIASGSANISGFSNQLILELDLKTEKGTDFKIPLQEGVDVSNADFLVFINSPDYNKEEAEKVDLSGIELSFDLEITPEAKLQIIFDEQVGDIIKAQGQGDLSMIINTTGDFNIFGQYLVEKGDYLFTLQNVINKKFEIAPKSSIYWAGDPYQAVLNMTAIYKLRAPLVDLFPSDSSDDFRRRTPIELGLKLSDQLMNPSIGFDIQLPESTEEIKRRLESVLYVNNNDVNPQEMNQQVFGLLVLNRFLPSSATTAVAGGYNAGAQSLNNGYEFVSNQLSNWASQLSENWDFGLKYQPADELNSDQFDFSLSRQFFNEKLTFDGNVGFTGDNAETQNQNSGFVGEFTAIYKIGDGRYRLKGFNRSVTNSLLQLNSPYTQGIGFFYRKEFDVLNELWK
ncbi:MAG: hypothetical protein ACI9DK_002896 [Vicingaceae bacterium]